MMTNGGTVGVGANFANAHIESYLAMFPMSRHWFFNLGTNDLCYLSSTQFRAETQSWISKVKAAGRVPILAHPIWANNVSSYCSQNGPSFNSDIDTLVQSNQLLPPVPLYEGTVGHGEYFDPGDVHPNHAGCRAWNQIFATYVKTYIIP
jgi:lysophospholipase L1-like esterase